VKSVSKSSRDHTLVAIDYGQIEARVIAMFSKDKAFVKALWDRYDVHGAWAEKIARVYPKRIGGKKFLTDTKVMKAFRTDIKNQWTFPLFFGAQLESAAGYLKIPPEELTKSYRGFQKEFKGVFEWQDELMEFYHEHGYVENLFGRRRRAPLSKNEVINSPVQGTACELIMDGMNRLSEKATETGDYNYQPVLNVHDELVFSFPTEEIDTYLDHVITEMLDMPFDFINVPITLEVSIGKNLLDMTEILVASSDDWGK